MGKPSQDQNIPSECGYHLCVIVAEDGEEKLQESLVYINWSHSLIKENHGWSLSKYPGSRIWSKSHGRILLTCLLILTSYTILSHLLKMTLHIVGGALSHQLLINKILYRLDYRPIIKVFFQLLFRLPRYICDCFKFIKSSKREKERGKERETETVRQRQNRLGIFFTKFTQFLHL